VLLTYYMKFIRLVRQTTDVVIEPHAVNTDNYWHRSEIDFLINYICTT